MSVLTRRACVTREQHERAIVAMRDDVVAATAAYLPQAGSGATVDAVDETLTELFARGEHLGRRDRVLALWIMGARWRLIDVQRSAACKRCDRVSVDEHAEALTLSASGDISELGDSDRESWRVREILSVLHGDQRVWAEAWLDAVLAGHQQPRGLADMLGWSTSKTEKVSERARKKIAAFVGQRHSGGVCAAQSGLLDAFTAMTAARHPGERVNGIDQHAYESVVFHVAGCEDCWAAWHAGRRALICHPALIWTVPVGKMIGALDVLHARVTGVLTRRVGLGGGAGAAAVGTSAALGGKAAGVICAGLVCAAATAGSGVLSAGSGVLGAIPILTTPSHHAHHKAAQHHTKVVKARTASVITPLARATRTAPPVTPAVVKTAKPGPQTKFTPGDLPTFAGTQTHPNTTLSAATTTPKPATSSSARKCFPGDLPPC